MYNTMKKLENLVYITSREDCQAAIDKSGCVCKCCGGILTPIETIDNSNQPTYWSGCASCQRYDYGVKPIIHEIAHQLVTRRFYRAYHNEQPDETKDPIAFEYWLKSQIGGISAQVQDIIYLYKELCTISINI